MTGRKDMVYWRTNPEWYTGDCMDPKSAKLTKKAPPKAIESYKRWLANAKRP